MKIKLLLTSLVLVGLQLSSSAVFGGGPSTELLPNSGYTPGPSGPITPLTTSPGTPDFTNPLTIDGSISDGSGPGGLSLFGSTVTISGANTYTGGTILDAGTLLQGAAATFPVGSALTLSSSGTFNLNGFDASVGALNDDNTGSIINSSTTSTNTLTISPAGGITNTFGGTISGPLALVIAGGEHQVLSGNNSYTGGTTISGGTLQLGSATALPAGKPVTLAAFGTLNLAGFSVSVGALNDDGSSSVINSTATASSLTISPAAGTTGTFGGTISGAISLVLAGRGTQVLTGNNTYTGTTTLNAGTLNLGSAGALGATTTISFGGGTLQFSAANTQDYSSSFSSAVNQAYRLDTNGQNVVVASALTSVGGSLNKSGAGTLELTAANTYTGATTVSGGILQQGVAGALPTGTALTVRRGGTFDLDGFDTTVGALNGTGTGIVTNSAAAGTNTLTVSPAAATTATFGGTISGPIALIMAGAGTEALTGSNSYTGGTTVNAGTLVVNSASLPGDVTVSNSSTLEFNQTVAGTYSGAITGTGTLLLEGAGALTLTGSTSVPITLTSGTLTLSNNQIGTTTVASGATLGGIGTIGGNLTNNGFLRPGDAPGPINVTGNFSQGSGGTLVIQLASPISFDRMIITGTGALAGTLEMDTIGGYIPANGASFDILTAAGGLGGTTFTTLTGSAFTGSAALSASVSYTATDVTVAFTQRPFTGFALTPNQNSLATAAQNDPALTAALDNVPLAGQLPGAFNALSPQGYEIWSDIAFAHATALADTVMRPDIVLPSDGVFYLDADQAHGRERQSGDVGQSTFTTTEGLVGGNHAVTPNLTLGGFFAYSESDADLGQPGSSTTVKDYTVGARAAWSDGSWFANAVLMYDFDDYNSSRVINFPGTSASAGSLTHGGDWTAGLTAGEHIYSGSWTFTHFVGVLVSGWRVNGFTENGAGAFDTTVGDQSATSLQTQVGIEAKYNWQVGSVMLHPHVSAAWLHEWDDSARQIDAGFGADNFSVTTQGPQRDSALVGAGLDVDLGARALLYSDLSAQTGNITTILGEWNVGVEIKF